MADISAKIAQLVSPTQVAFNAGSVQGVHQGDTATLYRDVEINDPDSKEPLGAVRVPRLTFRINFVQEKFSVGDVISGESSNTGFSGVSGVIFPGSIRLTTSPLEARSGVTLVKLGEDVTIHLADEAA